jgi:putative transposase
MSERRACHVIKADRKMVPHRSRRPMDGDLRLRTREPAGEQRRFGYGRLHGPLRDEERVVNRKKTPRLYRDEGLSARRRRSRKRAMGTRAPILVAATANARRSLDFVHDGFWSGRRFRILDIICDVTKERLGTIADNSISARRLVRELDARP